MFTIKPILRWRACLLLSENIIETVVFVLGKAVKLPLKTEVLKLSVCLLELRFYSRRKSSRENVADSAGIEKKESKRKVQGVPQSQTAALPRHQEEEDTDKTKQAQIEQKTEISTLFPKRGNRNAKRTEKHKNKITKGKT